jgi:hypothetical protein
MGGVHSHPGFHTAGSLEIAGCYAQEKVVSHPATLFLKPETLLSDYPVIVVVDMDGYVPKADYDAERTMAPAVRDVLSEFFRMNPEASRRDLTRWLEMDTYEEQEAIERGYPANSALFRIGSWRVMDPAGALRDFVDGYAGDDAMDLLREFARTGKASDAFLCALSDQYRYTEDVDERRVAKVLYVKPFWPDVLDYQADQDVDEFDPGQAVDDAQLSERLEELGWATLDVEDVGRGNAAFSTKAVYQSRRAPARPEYHGTSYRNLISAAPGIGRRLPIPPKPYRGSK